MIVLTVSLYNPSVTRDSTYIKKVINRYDRNDYKLMVQAAGRGKHYIHIIRKS